MEIQKMQQRLKKFSRKYAWVAGLLSLLWWVGTYAEHGWHLVRHWL
jgi:hypothetical protein